MCFVVVIIHLHLIYYYFLIVVITTYMCCILCAVSINYRISSSISMNFTLEGGPRRINPQYFDDFRSSEKKISMAKRSTKLNNEDLSNVED